MTPEDRENIVDLLIRWRIEIEMARGLPVQRAEDLAEREVRVLLDQAGGRAWYLPKAKTQNARALEFRDEAIRAAVAKGLTFLVIRRSFRLSRGHFYRIINGYRTGNKKIA